MAFTVRELLLKKKLKMGSQVKYFKSFLVLCNFLQKNVYHTNNHLFLILRLFFLSPSQMRYQPASQPKAIRRQLTRAHTACQSGCQSGSAIRCGGTYEGNLVNTAGESYRSRILKLLCANLLQCKTSLPTNRAQL